MRQPCKFEKVEGKWKCKYCDYICRLSHNRPPVRTCSVAYITPPIKPKIRPLPAPKPIRNKPRRKPRKATPPPSKRELDAKTIKALAMVDVDKSLVKKYLGAPCGCVKRRAKVAKLNTYVSRILKEEPDMKQHLLDLLTE